MTGANPKVNLSQPVQPEETMISEPSKLVAEVGRVKAYRKNPERGTLPVSCTIWVHKEGLIELGNTITFITHALQVGSGINVHLDYWQPLVKPKTERKLRFNCKTFSLEKHWEYVGLPSAHLIEVDDSINGPNGIIQSLLKYIELAQNTDKTITVDLNKLRPAGHTNSLGMVATGPESFAVLFIRANQYLNEPNIEHFLAFLSSFNEVIRRGGVYKNGALTTSMPTHHPHVLEYVEAFTFKHAWLKKGASLVSDFGKFWKHKGIDLVELLVHKVNQGELWLEKITDLDGNWINLVSYKTLGEQAILRSNVCREIRIRSGETCTLGHVNAGMCNIGDLVKAFIAGMKHLIEVHKENAPGKDTLRQFIDGSIDRQVGLGVLGWANYLRLQGVTYERFIGDLTLLINHPRAQELMVRMISYFNDQGELEVSSDGFVQHIVRFRETNSELVGDIGYPSEVSNKIAWDLFMGYAAASSLARKYKLDRAFCIAPTASSSFAHEDLIGFTTAPEIAPPVYQKVERLSQILDGEGHIYDYGAVETAESVGWLDIWTMYESWQTLMDLTGLAHSISFNILEDMDTHGFNRWSKGPLLTTYYRLEIKTGHLDKTGASLLGPVGASPKPVGASSPKPVGASSSEPVGASCTIDDTGCSACAG